MTYRISFPLLALAVASGRAISFLSGEGKTALIPFGGTMSLATRRVSSSHLSDVLICAAMLVSLGACYPAPSVESQPAFELAGERQQPTAEQRQMRRFAGVDVVPMGRGAFVVQIHSGMVGSGPPLYIIDGAPITLSPNRGIDWFKPEDIAQIRVLKGPAELAVYGPNGVNGVIVITTKQGLNPRS